MAVHIRPVHWWTGMERFGGDRMVQSIVYVHGNYRQACDIGNAQM